MRIKRIAVLGVSILLASCGGKDGGSGGTTTSPVAYGTRLISLLFALNVFPYAYAGEPTLTILGNGSQSNYTRTELLKRPDVVQVVIVGDVAYKRDMSYQAIPFAALLDRSRPDVDSFFQFVAADGFVAELPAAPLLNRDPNRAIAYLAVEPSDEPWPALKAGEKFSAGPFYLVWIHPERANIGPEQWPYQVAKIELRPPVRKRWPAIAPDTQVEKNSAVDRGFALYQKNCLACHQLNRSGEATKGPDLNLPMSPTEYFQPDALRKLIRNPQSVRTWSNSSMPGFDEKTLSNAELEDLLDYLKHMAKRKVKS